MESGVLNRESKNSSTNSRWWMHLSEDETCNFAERKISNNTNVIEDISDIQSKTVPDDPEVVQKNIFVVKSKKMRYSHAFLSEAEPSPSETQDQYVKMPCSDNEVKPKKRRSKRRRKTLKLFPRKSTRHNFSSVFDVNHAEDKLTASLDGSTSVSQNNEPTTAGDFQQEGIFKNVARKVRNYSEAFAEEAGNTQGENIAKNVGNREVKDASESGVSSSELTAKSIDLEDFKVEDRIFNKIGSGRKYSAAFPTDFIPTEKSEADKMHKGAKDSVLETDNPQAKDIKNENTVKNPTNREINVATESDVRSFEVTAKSPDLEEFKAEGHIFKKTGAVRKYSVAFQGNFDQAEKNEVDEIQREIKGDLVETDKPQEKITNSENRARNADNREIKVASKSVVNSFELTAKSPDLEGFKVEGRIFKKTGADRKYSTAFPANFDQAEKTEADKTQIETKGNSAGPHVEFDGHQQLSEGSENCENESALKPSLSYSDTKNAAKISEKIAAGLKEEIRAKDNTNEKISESDIQSRISSQMTKKHSAAFNSEENQAIKDNAGNFKLGESLREPHKISAEMSKTGKKHSTPFLTKEKEDFAIESQNKEILILEASDLNPSLDNNAANIFEKKSVKQRKYSEAFLDFLTERESLVEEKSQEEKHQNEPSNLSERKISTNPEETQKTQHMKLGQIPEEKISIDEEEKRSVEPRNVSKKKISIDLVLEEHETKTKKISKMKISADAKSLEEIHKKFEHSEQEIPVNIESEEEKRSIEPRNVSEKISTDFGHEQQKHETKTKNTSTMKISADAKSMKELHKKLDELPKEEVPTNTDSEAEKHPKKLKRYSKPSTDVKSEEENHENSDKEPLENSSMSSKLKGSQLAVKTRGTLLKDSQKSHEILEEKSARNITEPNVQTEDSIPQAQIFQKKSKILRKYSEAFADSFKATAALKPQETASDAFPLSDISSINLSEAIENKVIFRPKARKSLHKRQNSHESGDKSDDCVKKRKLSSTFNSIDSRFFDTSLISSTKVHFYKQNSPNRSERLTPGEDSLPERRFPALREEKESPDKPTVGVKSGDGILKNVATEKSGTHFGVNFWDDSANLPIESAGKNSCKFTPKNDIEDENLTEETEPEKRRTELGNLAEVEAVSSEFVQNSAVVTANTLRQSKSAPRKTFEMEIFEEEAEDRNVEETFRNLKRVGAVSSVKYSDESAKKSALNKSESESDKNSENGRFEEGTEHTKGGKNPRKSAKTSVFNKPESESDETSENERLKEETAQAKGGKKFRKSAKTSALNKPESESDKTSKDERFGEETEHTRGGNKIRKSAKTLPLNKPESSKNKTSEYERLMEETEHVKGGKKIRKSTKTSLLNKPEIVSNQISENEGLKEETEHEKGGKTFRKSTKTSAVNKLESASNETSEDERLKEKKEGKKIRKSAKITALNKPESAINETSEDERLKEETERTKGGKKLRKSAKSSVLNKPEIASNQISENEGLKEEAEHEKGGKTFRKSTKTSAVNKLESASNETSEVERLKEKKEGKKIRKSGKITALNKPESATNETSEDERLKEETERTKGGKKLRKSAKSSVLNKPEIASNETSESEGLEEETEHTKGGQKFRKSAVSPYVYPKESLFVTTENIFKNVQNTSSEDELLKGEPVHGKKGKKIRKSAEVGTNSPAEYLKEPAVVKPKTSGLNQFSNAINATNRTSEAEILKRESRRKDRTLRNSATVGEFLPTDYGEESAVGTAKTSFLLKSKNQPEDEKFRRETAGEKVGQKFRSSDSKKLGDFNIKEIAVLKTNEGFPNKEPSVNEKGVNEMKNDINIRTKQTRLENFFKRTKENSSEYKDVMKLLENKYKQMNTEPSTSSKRSFVSSEEVSDILSRYKTPDIPPLIVKKKPAKPKNQNVNSARMIDGKIYRPRKLFAKYRWCNKRFYKFLQDKMRNKHGLNTIIESENLMKLIADSVTVITKSKTYNVREVEYIKKALVSNEIVKTNYDFFCFVDDYLPFEFSRKVVPSVQAGSSETTVPYEHGTLLQDIKF